VRLPGGERESYGSATAIGDGAGLGAVAATRAAKRLTQFALLRAFPFLDAPAASWCALMLVPSRNAMPGLRPWARAAPSNRRHGHAGTRCACKINRIMFFGRVRCRTSCPRPVIPAS
jgi:hypothetical protein